MTVSPAGTGAAERCSLDDDAVCGEEEDVGGDSCLLHPGAMATATMAHAISRVSFILGTVSMVELVWNDEAGRVLRCYATPGPLPPSGGTPDDETTVRRREVRSLGQPGPGELTRAKRPPERDQYRRSMRSRSTSAGVGQLLRRSSLTARLELPGVPLSSSKMAAALRCGGSRR